MNDNEFAREIAIARREEERVKQERRGGYIRRIDRKGKNPDGEKGGRQIDSYPRAGK